MSRGNSTGVYTAAAGTYLRWLFAVPLLALVCIVFFTTMVSLKPWSLWYFAVAWGAALGLHWKEYLARPEALLCLAMRQGQIGVGVGLTVVLLGISMMWFAFGEESLFSILAVQLSGFVLGLSLTQFVRNWMSFVWIFLSLGTLSPNILGEKFLADWMIGESIWPSLFAVGASLCGGALIVDRYFTMSEESFEYWQPLLTWKGMREYQLQKSKRRGGDTKRQWNLWERMEEKRYRWLTVLPLGQSLARRDRHQLRYLAWNFSVVRSGILILFLLAFGWGFDQLYFWRSQFSVTERPSTLMMMFPMSLIFCLMPLQLVAMGEKYRVGEMMRPLSRREWGRELLVDALLACASLWSLLAAGMLIVGWLWPDRVPWGGATLMTGLVLVSCFFFCCGLLLYLLFAFEISHRDFNIASVGIPAAFMPVLILNQAGMLPTVGTEVLVLMSLGGIVVGVLFILKAYRRLCEMDIG